MRGTYTPTVDQSEHVDDGCGQSEREQMGGEWYPAPIRSTRIGAVAAILSANTVAVAGGEATTAGHGQVGCPSIFRPWCDGEPLSDMQGLRPSRGVRNAGRTKRLHSGPPAEPQPLDLSVATGRHNKNSMSRARRIEANIRERYRTRTICEAYDTLRTRVPAYSDTQNSSRVSTIRRASEYIQTLFDLLDIECGNDVTRIVPLDGEARKGRDEQ